VDAWLIFTWAATPHLKGAGTRAPQFWGSLLFMRIYTLCRRTTKFDVVTRVGEWRVSWSQPRLHPKTAEVQRFPIYGVVLIITDIPLPIDPLTQNDPVRHGNINGEGVFLGQPRHCVARFVGDS